MDGELRMLAGRYELAEVIGRGGMGTVYRATDVVLDRTVAVKVLAAALVEEDPVHVARFEREARAAASLAHPGVVAVYDTGADEATRFIVMEYVAGSSLAEILRDDAPLEPGRAVSIAERVADALVAAHAAGIVHRDVKPGNVMVADDGSVKVLDFGIARALDGTALTQTASVLGTAAYMAPEQALGERADERSDIYSLGCLLYALLTGRPPFTGEAAAAITHQHVSVDPRPLREANRGVSPALDALVMQMLAKSADARPQSAAQVRDRLGQALAASPATASASTAPTAPQQRTADTTRVLARAARVKHGRLAAAAALCAGVLLVAVIALASGGGSRHAAPAARRASTATKSTRAPASSRTPATRPSATNASAPAAGSSNTTSPSTVSGAAGALTSLVTQDVQSGKIDQEAAKQITNGLAEILNSFEMGHTMDAQHKLADLSQKMATLESQGRISSTAASPLNAALSSLSSALARSAPATTPGAPSGQTGQPPGQGGQPPGHGGEPPGQTKKHGDSHGNKHGG